MPATAWESATVAVERPSDGIAVLTFSVPDHRHNVLTGQVLADLSAALDALGRGPAPRGLILR